MADYFSDYSKLTPEEQWEKATIANNYIFYYVMHENPDICKEVIERLLQIEIDHIEMAQEEVIKVDMNAKSIRMDVYIKNATQAFDLEIQALDTHELPERARYYQGIIDVDTLKSGELYSELKDSYIIFICITDIFGKGLPIYRFENLCTDDSSISLNDRAYKYFFISSKYGKIRNEKQRNFLQLVMNNEKTDELSSKILEKVKSAKQNILVRKGYMDLIREKAYAAKAAEKRKADEDAIAFLKEGLSPDLIAKCINLPLEHVKELAEQLEK
ncbi:MAG: Rpn family recombination-promoting nuclease/putative transposase [Treponemataceae bacterium]|nr:Rpn family recombination-promoting nuclease/putative transposase [Treponemataceae bacterium]